MHSNDAVELEMLLASRTFILNTLDNGPVNGKVNFRPWLCHPFSNFLSFYFVSDEAGIRRSDIVNQYLKDIESQIDSEEELAEKKILVDKVLDRLTTHVSMFL